MKKSDSKDKIINNKEKCEHHFILDYIDITPERSERIIYCTKCEECRETFPDRNKNLK